MDDSWRRRAGRRRLGARPEERPEERAERPLMPYFPARSQSSLSNSIRNAVAGLGGELSGLDQIQAEQLAAKTAHEQALATKVRLEADAAAQAAADRADPNLVTRFAAHAAGLDEPTGAQLAASLRGDVEQPSAADRMDAELVGAEAQPFRVSAPDVTPGARRQFQAV